MWAKVSLKIVNQLLLLDIESKWTKFHVEAADLSCGCEVVITKPLIDA